jgi:hypothetical protein
MAVQRWMKIQSFPINNIRSKKKAEFHFTFHAAPPLVFIKSPFPWYDSVAQNSFPQGGA